MSGLLLVGGDDAEVPVGDVNERAEIEWPFTPRAVFANELMVDHSYQRPVEERWVNERVGEFEPSLVGFLDVSLRENGERAILDGQQRWELLTRVDRTTVWTAEYTGMSRQDEAGYFYRKNKDRKSMQGFYGFRARKLAGDLEAAAIQQAVEALDFELGPATDDTRVIGSMTAIERAWRFPSEYRNECLTPALETIKAVYYGRAKSLRSTPILGLAQFWRAYDDDEVDVMALNRVLGRIGSPENLIGLGRDRLRQLGTQWRLPLAVAMAIVEHYNDDRSREGRPTLDPDALR